MSQQNDPIPRADKRLATLHRRLQYTFRDPATLLDHVLIAPGRRKKTEFEQLELLGDSVLRTAVLSIAYEKLRDVKAGELARIIAIVCSNANLALMAFRLGLPGLVTQGSGMSTLDELKPVADTTEALLGAVFQDGGQRAVTQVCFNLFRLDIWLAQINNPRELLRRKLRESNRNVSLTIHHKPSSAGKPFQGTVAQIKVGNEIIVKHVPGYTATAAEENASAIAVLQRWPERDRSNGSLVTPGDRIVWNFK